MKDVKVLIDGKEVQCDQVKIIAEVASVNSREISEFADLYLTFNYEGVVLDLLERIEGGTGANAEVTETAWQTYDDLVDKFWR